MSFSASSASSSSTHLPFITIVSPSYPPEGVLLPSVVAKATTPHNRPPLYTPFRVSVLLIPITVTFLQLFQALTARQSDQPRRHNAGTATVFGEPPAQYLRYL